MRKVYTIGETVLDIIFKDLKPVAAKTGGAMVNTTISLGRLKVPVSLLTEYGNDQVGTIIDNFLKDNGVSTEYIQRYDDGKSSISMAFLDDKNNAQYSFYKNYPAKRLNFKMPPVAENDVVLFGSYYGMADEVRESVINFIHYAREHKAIIVYDPNYRKAHEFELEKMRPNILENMSLAHIVRGSDEDFSFIFNSQTPEEAYNKVKTLCPNLIVTANQKGIYVFSGSVSKKYPVETIQPVSTVGAGDTFNAGIVYSLLKQDVRLEGVNNITENQWDGIVKTATAFATHVCLSYDNYISKEFAQKFQ
ncbi:MAG: carbohydrate kinase [Bacteroidota bacterium]|nr:carbohydrate kinase [Bacteroidota bacterium]MDP4225789.1 carbohydrate kinase [Bacteroidota bacterium]MDP4273155.1 carbohydrate kinase [Bacteroidota bacterium]